MQITGKKLEVYSRMVDGKDGLRSPDLFEAAFLDKGFSKSNMLLLLGWKNDVYENRRDKLQNFLTLRHLKRMAKLLSMDLKDVVEVVERNAPINQMGRKDAETLLAKNHYGINDVKWG